MIARLGRGRADDDDGARRGAQARPDDRAGPAVLVRVLRGTAEDQQVGVVGVIEQDTRRQAFGDLGVHAHAGIKAAASRTDRRRISRAAPPLAAARRGPGTA